MLGLIFLLYKTNKEKLFHFFKVWILTGDKKETAINISRSCGHWRPNMQLIDIAGKVIDTKYSMPDQKRAGFCLEDT